MHILRTTLLVLTCIAILGTPGVAHEAAKGRHGGLRIDAGKYHTELVANGTTSVVVYISDVDDKPVPAAGFKANAILIVDGRPQRFVLAPGEGSQLVGTSPVPVKPGVKGAIQLTAPDGTTAQAKF